MKAPLTTSERMIATLEKAQSEGKTVSKFVIGQHELECFIEWANDAQLLEFTSGRFMGVQVGVVDVPRFFSYELVELVMA